MPNARRPEGLGSIRSYPVAAATHIYAGDAVCLNSSGYAVPASAATGLISVGACVQELDNSLGDAGDLNVDVKRGVFGFPGASGDEPTIATIGDVVYFSGAQEIGVTATGRSVAGVYEYQDASDGLYYVSLAEWPMQAGLLAASNLADVGSPATARASIGANTFEMCFSVDDLVGADAHRFGFVAPKAFTITSIRSVLLGAALTTGDATLTGKIAGTPITSGVVTITQSGSAVGDLDSASPSAANAVAAGQFVEVTVGGTNDAAGARAQVTISGTF